MKIGELMAYGFGAVLGILLGLAGFLRLYLPLKAGLGLGSAAVEGLGGEGPIVPMETLLPIYATAGGLIDLIVLLTFLIGGMYGVLGILQALRRRPQP
ncbi:MAG: hypothetical protein LUQ23_02325 [Methanomicrobiales archaeon]|nr:hypothetical protein [Methanomicrobiales archaeon]